MVTKRTIVRAVVVVEVTWYHIVMVVVPIDFGGVIVVVTSVVAEWTLVMILMAVVPLVATRRTCVIRRIAAAKLNAQAPGSERETLSFGCWGISDGHQAYCEHWGGDPFEEGVHGNNGLGWRHGIHWRADSRPQHWVTTMELRTACQLTVVNAVLCLQTEICR
jgi:hypothetical protein